MNKKNNKILIIDDSDDTLDLMEVFLYNYYDVITAHNGFDALNRAQEEAPDCIITDIMMPVMDGIKFFNNLKKNDKISHIPVIAMTSFIKKMSTKSLLNIGFSDVISKPLKLDIILIKVQKIMETASDHAE